MNMYSIILLWAICTLYLKLARGGSSLGAELFAKSKM